MSQRIRSAATILASALAVAILMWGSWLALSSASTYGQTPTRGQNIAALPVQADEPVYVAQKTAKPKSKTKDDPPPEFEGVPPGVCRVCLGTKYIPLAARRVYVHVEGQRPPDAAVCVPWRFCPTCQAGREHDELVQAEAQRLKTAGDSNDFWERKGGVRLVRVETRHVAIHCDLPADQIARQGLAAEALAELLQRQTNSVLLTQTRPGTTEQILLWERAKYLRMIDVCATLDEFRGTQDWDLVRKLSGVFGQVTAVGDVQAGKGPPPENKTISNLAMRQIRLATNHKLGDWLSCGFAYSCEYALTKKVAVHYVDYKLNETPLGLDWMAEARAALARGGLRPWDELFTASLQNFSAADHVTSFAAVSHLFQSDPRKFAVFCVALRGGAEPQRAIAEIYGKPLREVQADFARWLARR